MNIAVTTNEQDFPHDVLKTALAKYVEKYNGALLDEEAMEEVKKDISKFLNRLVRTEAEVDISADKVHFELKHVLR